MKSRAVGPGQSILSGQANTNRDDARGGSLLLPHQMYGSLALGTTPTNGQTVSFVISGSTVTFQAVTGTPTNPGDVKAPGTAAGFVANLVAALRRPDLVTTTYVPVSSADQTLLQLLGWAYPGASTTIVPFSLDKNVNGATDLISGFSVSTTVTSGAWTANQMALYVEDGTFYIGITGRELFTGGVSPTFTAPVSNPRIDLLAINSAGTLSIVEGTEGSSPSAPSYPKDKIVLCEVYHVVGETALYDTENQQSGEGYISADVRPFLMNGEYISQTGAEIYAADSGAANAYAITLAPAPAAYGDGLTVQFKAGNANTGASTINVNGLGIVAITKNYDLGLIAGDILADQIITAVYNSTLGGFQMVGQSGTASSGESPYGDGSDGSVTFDGTTTILGMAPSSSIYTLTRDIFCVNLTGNTGVSINTNGYQVFISGTLTQNGTFKFFNNGGVGGNASGQTGGSAATKAPGVTVPAGTATVAGVNGGNGGGNGAGGTGVSGIAGTSVSNAVASAGITPTGNSGGGGTGNQSAGPAGTIGASSTATASPTRINTAQIARTLATWLSAVWTQFAASGSNPSAGGAGGGGGFNSGGNGGSGGGSGAPGANGGWVVVFAYNIVSSGQTLYQAKGGVGGNGGNGGNASGSLDSGGGGAGAPGLGGNGGVVVDVHHSVSGSLVYDVSGGANGTAGTAGTGVAGGATGATSTFTGTPVAGQTFTIVV